MKERILFVDEEESFLLAYRRSLEGQYEVGTAAGGRAGLEELLGAHDYPVVFVDAGLRRLPAAQFVGKCLKARPRAIVVLIATQQTLEGALAAVNAGPVFRIVHKPLSIVALRDTISAALAERQRLDAERELLDATARAAVESWLDFLRHSDPAAHLRAEIRQRRAQAIATKHDLPGETELGLAAQLAEIGRLAVPEVLSASGGSESSDGSAADEVAEAIALASAEIVERLPRFERPAELIRYQAKRFDGSGPPEDLLSGPSIPRGARLLHVLLALEQYEQAGVEPSEAFEKMRAVRGRFDPRLLEACELQLTERPGELELGREMSVEPAELAPGDLLLVNLYSGTGSLLLASGTRLNEPMVGSVRRQARQSGVRTPIYVERSLRSRQPSA